MATAKQEHRRMLDALPNDPNRESIQYSVYLRERIERRQRGTGEGKAIDQKEIQHRMKRWDDE